MNNQTELTPETRGKLKELSKAILRLHKTLLEGAKAEFETKNGKIQTPSQYLALVLDDPHFAWLRKLSTMIALIDEANSVRRPASEADGLALFGEAKILLDFEDADEDFNDKFQAALQNNPDAVINHNDALQSLWK
jgi:hypothetical protein